MQSLNDLIWNDMFDIEKNDNGEEILGRINPISPMGAMTVFNCQSISSCCAGSSCGMPCVTGAMGCR